MSRQNLPTPADIEQCVNRLHDRYHRLDLAAIRHRNNPPLSHALEHRADQVLDEIDRLMLDIERHPAKTVEDAIAHILAAQWIAGDKMLASRSDYRWTRVHDLINSGLKVIAASRAQNPRHSAA